MIPAKFNLPIFAFASVCLCSAANASTLFTFHNDNLGTTSDFTDTVNGLSATFSSSADPGGFIVYPSFFETPISNPSNG